MSLPEHKREQIAAAITRFHNLATNAMRVLGAVDDLIGIEPESILNSIVTRLIDGYISALGDAYAVHGWLDWWAWECRFGANPLGAQVGENPIHEVATVDDLIALVLETLDLPEDAAEESGKGVP